MNNDYFKNDDYWKDHINKEIEDDMWIEEYRDYFKIPGKCLELGCGIGQYSKELMNFGYEVISTDISNIALNEVKKFNSNTMIVDMSKSLPFESNSFDLVFANLSIHYFDDRTTKGLMNEIKRILKKDGLFIGSVNGTEGYNVIKDTVIKVENNFYFNKNKYIRLFDEKELRKYLDIFNIELIHKLEHKKNYYIFIVRKEG